MEVGASFKQKKMLVLGGTGEGEVSMLHILTFLLNHSQIYYAESFIKVRRVL